MMDCKLLAEKLLLFRDGNLSAEETEEVRQHLHLCPPCMGLFNSYEEVVEVLERLRPVNMPEDFLARLKTSMSQGETGGPSDG